MRLVRTAILAAALLPAAAFAQSPPTAGPPNYTIVVTAQELAVIGAALVERPFREVDTLMSNLRRQASEQQTRAQGAPLPSGEKPSP